MMESRETSEDFLTETTRNAERAAELIRQKLAVRWPAGHVELALITLQRRRQQRRVIGAGVTLGVGGLALLLALVPELPGHLGLVPSRRLSAVSASVAAPASAPARRATASVGVGVGSPGATVQAPSPRAAVTPAAAPAPAGHILQQRLVPRRQVAAARWVTLAGQKRFGEAYGLLKQVPLGQLSEPDDLMLAADVARQAGRPERAVPFLERVVKEHGRELSAQLAGFSLGKIYLENIDDPALAARHFAAVRGMAPTGGLAQDALAREVEGWARAGMTERARAAATEYVRLYPMGRRLAAVRDLGGI